MARAFPIKRQGPLCEDKAYVLGFFAGDGNVTVGADGSAHVSANCGEVSNPANKVTADRIARMLRGIYDVPVKVRKELRINQEGRQPYWQPILYRKAVAADLLSFGPIGTYDWRVPSRVARRPRLFAAWLSGFSDAEGHVAHHPESGCRYIAISSVNQSGLEQAGELAGQLLGIRCSWHTDEKKPIRSPGCLEEHKILICNRRALEAFADKVGFRQPDKKQTLGEALDSYKRPHANLLSSEVSQSLPEVLRRRAAGETFSEIASELGLATTDVPKGMIKRASKAVGDRCLICLAAEATHSIPRIIRGRSAAYVCEPCLTDIESKAMQLP